MTRTHIIVLIVLVILAVGVAVVVTVIRRSGLKHRRQAHQLLYHDLRNQVLKASAEIAGIEEPTPKHGVWCVLVDTTYPEGSFTLVALLDGSCSLYGEKGGGIFGGGHVEDARKAAVAVVKMADEYVSECKPTKEFPLPSVGDTTFYILTTSGAYTATAKEEDLGESRHRLSPLFHAVHEVIFQLRQPVKQ